jgi:hypothetical protein
MGQGFHLNKAGSAAGIAVWGGPVGEPGGCLGLEGERWGDGRQRRGSKDERLREGVRRFPAGYRF